MNLWPKASLAHWIQRAKKGEKIRVAVSVEKEEIYRAVELLTVKGYELYRIFNIEGAKEKIIIKKPSVSAGGYHDDPEPLKRENIAIANLRFQRDIDRLKEAGIEVKNEPKFAYEKIWR